jgi:hypothetical protein
MKTIGVICVAAAAAVAGSLLATAPSLARNLNLQNQNHVGHCVGVGNCRAGRTGTSQPVAGASPHGGLSSAGAHAALGGGGKAGRKR